MASITKGANLYLKSNSILDWKFVPAPGTVKTPRENQNLNTHKSSPLNAQDITTKYSTSSIFKSETNEQFIDNFVEGKKTELSYDVPPFSVQ